MKKIGFLGWICQLIVILWAINSGVVAILQKDPWAKSSPWSISAPMPIAS